MQHPDEGTIHAWLDGALPEREAAALAAHVGECPACAERVREARGLMAGASRIVAATDWGVGAGIAGRPPRASGVRHAVRRRRVFFTPWRSAAAAVLLVGAGTLVVARETGRSSVPETPRSTGLVARVESATAAQGIVAPRPAPVLPKEAVPAAPAVAPARRAPIVAAPAPRPPMAAPRAAASGAAMPESNAMPRRADADMVSSVAAKQPVDTTRPALERVVVTGLGSAGTRLMSAPATARASARERATVVGAYATDRRPGAGCYEVVADSAPADLPRRLVLEGGGTVRVDGAVLEGAAWRQSAPTAVEVVRLSADTVQVLRIGEVSGALTGEVLDRTGARKVGIRRCD